MPTNSLGDSSQVWKLYCRNTGIEEGKMFGDQPEIVYQIMPDRFYRHSEALPGQDLEAWNALPDESKGGTQFFGGTLRGIQEKIPYLKELGITTLLLTPIFKAPSYHKYDAEDFYSIDPNFGSEDDFEALLKALHENSIKLILDIALNHLSNEHPFFKKALADPSSKERGFFRFSSYPERYDCWWNNSSMPELNFANKELRELFIEGEASIIRYWVRKGIDGIRLDCANDLSKPIVELIRKVSHEENPHCYVFGEIFSYAADWTNHMDGIQNYMYSAGFFRVYSNEIPSRIFNQWLNDIQKDSSLPVLNRSLSMFSSHDTARAYTLVKKNYKRLAQMLLLQYTLPGIPMIYYGEENGMQGKRDPHNRATMNWNPKTWNQRIRKLYTLLIEEKKSAAIESKIIPLTEYVPDGVIAYLSYNPKEKTDYRLILLNMTGVKKKFILMIPYSYIYSFLKLVDIFSSKSVTFVNNGAAVELLAYDAVCLKPAPEQTFKNYSFFKTYTL
jgi:glycosidase